jgi:hypothetical protein
MLIGCFEKLTQRPDVQIPAMMDSIPQLLNEMDPEGVGRVALWLHAADPLPEHAPRGGDDIQTEFSDVKVDTSK